MKKYRSPVVIVIGCLLPLCGAKQTQGQSMFRGDPAHSGVYSGKAPRKFHRVKWRFPTGDRVVSSPVFANNIIYFGGDDSNIYAVNADTGVQVWKYPTGGPVPATPAVVDGILYAGSYDGKFYALDAKTGTAKWKFATEGERRFEAKGLHGAQPRNQTVADTFDIYLSSPVVVDKTVYFGSGDGHLYALDANSGDLKWKFKTGDVVHASPAYADGVVYVGSWDSYFYAVDATTGKERWKFQGGEDPLLHNQVGFQSSPAVMNGIVYTGCRDSNVYALDVATGKEKWRFNNEMSWVNSAPAVAGGKVFFVTSDSCMHHAIDAATGKSVHKQKGSAYMFSSPAIAGDVVLVGVLNGTLEARDINTGELLWDYQVEKSKQDNGWILTADRKFNFPLIFRSNWRESPIMTTEKQMSVGSIFSSPLVVNGVIYFGSTDGYLYALE
ncbi:MAG TPA: PQQ-binding-like beta-propeller repeat protein [Chthoniobacterales bacterium]|nr:PQQ-binding-like beta-propeller repeat protein [Chthoniobacterales bacterium]